MTKDNTPAVQRADAKRIRPEGMTRGQWKKRKRVNKITEFWPKLFDINNPKPLKLNIMQDMVKDIQSHGLDLGVGAVRVALNAYTSHARYVRCVAAGGMRYDLKGEPCGEVTEAAIKHAKEKFKVLERKFRAGRNRSDNSDGKHETEGAANGG
ncbi:TPA: ProQ/FinO family protein [Salmonella enterica subsp. houtenae]|nr:ProQ/FinO family protein [Salmonella enterica subsp. houtenae]